MGGRGGGGKGGAGGWGEKEWGEEEEGGGEASGGRAMVEGKGVNEGYRQGRVWADKEERRYTGEEGRFGGESGMALWLLIKAARVGSSDEHAAASG